MPLVLSGTEGISTTGSKIYSKGFQYSTASPGQGSTWGPNIENGYIGDDPFQGITAAYCLGSLGSSSTTNASSNLVSFYTTGHWGEYTKLYVWCQSYYYNPGFAMWTVDGGTVTNIRAFGSYGSISVASTQIGSGTHSGQNAYRYDITCSNAGTYTQIKWYVGHIGGGNRGHFSNDFTQQQMDDYLKYYGGGVHLKSLSWDQIKSSPLAKNTLG